MNELQACLNKLLLNSEVNFVVLNNDTGDVLERVPVKVVAQEDRVDLNLEQDLVIQTKKLDCSAVRFCYEIKLNNVTCYVLKELYPMYLENLNKITIVTENKNAVQT